MKPKQIDLEEAIAAKMKEKGLTREGAEMPDPTPIAPPIGYKKQPSMFEYIREQIQVARYQAHLEAQGLETPDEADDFEVGDDFEHLPGSAYEHPDMPAVDPPKIPPVAAVGEGGGAPKPPPAAAPPPSPVAPTPPLDSGDK